jgi:hypothetical protein
MLNVFIKSHSINRSDHFFIVQYIYKYNRIQYHTMMALLWQSLSLTIHSLKKVEVTFARQKWRARAIADERRLLSGQA